MTSRSKTTWQFLLGFQNSSLGEKKPSGLPRNDRSINHARCYAFTYNCTKIGMPKNVYQYLYTVNGAYVYKITKVN